MNSNASDTITMKSWFCLTMLLCTLAQAAPGDARILAAREAFRNGERTRLAMLADAGTQAGQHDLEPWVEYWRVRQRLAEGGEERIPDFLQRQEGSYLAEKLRGDWLREVGKQGRWEDFQREFPRLVEPDAELVCYALRARFDAQQDATALDEARSLWFDAMNMPESCMPLMDQLVLAKRIDVDAVWDRMRRLLAIKQIAAARRAAEYLPAAQIPAPRTLETVFEKPQRMLDKAPADFAATRLGREMALYAVQRLSRIDPASAAGRWQKIEERFSAADRGFAWGQIAWQGALRHMPEAAGWYAKAWEFGNPRLSDEQIAWQARTALRAHDWPAVQSTIALMPAQMAAQPDWIYWQGRALAAQGRVAEADALYQRISGQPNFYGNLADEELGRMISVPPRAPAPTADEMAAAGNHPGLRRALALLRLDLRFEGVREWNWALRGMDDRQLLAAAELARRNGVFDRAIFTADRTQSQHDYALRYLAPFHDSVVRQAQGIGLDSNWVYGLMRQESRFVMSANSSAGARGLMQLMPATAAWVARKIGLKNYHPSQVATMETNLELGTNYLQMVLASLDNHPLLASTAYNAGPGRARRWCSTEPLEGAIYAETIPFDETRDYVKKVMSNAVYYSALFEKTPQSLKSRMGTVGPRRVAYSIGATKVSDLP